MTDPRNQLYDDDFKFSNRGKQCEESRKNLQSDDLYGFKHFASPEAANKNNECGIGVRLLSFFSHFH